MNPLAEDLDHVLAHTPGVWDELRDANLFITGGTGFFGCWLLESFAWANDKLGLKATATVLTRNPDAFRRKASHLAEHPAVRLLRGDVRTFEFPEGQYSHVIHAATDTSAGGQADPLVLFDTIVEGTRRVLEFAAQAGTRKLLLTSSGAVYGKQPPDLTHIPEEYAGAPDPLDPRSAYGEGKRAAEHLCCLYGQRHGFEVKIARCFAFVGPYLPLDGHFAVGNFIRDALAGGPIRVQGDGTPHRSYLYAADLALWLWTILARGRPGRAYNVGSTKEISIAELACAVSAGFPDPIAIEIMDKRRRSAQEERYVPSTTKAFVELNLCEIVDLPAALTRTMGWHRREVEQ